MFGFEIRVVSDPSWTDVATAIGALLSALVALGILIGAGASILLLRRQINELESSRQSASLPVVVRGSVEIVPGFNSATVYLTNIGAGPALEIRVSLWIANTRDELLETRRSSEHGHFSGREHGIAASNEPIAMRLNRDLEVPITPMITAEPSDLELSIELEYTDIFGRPFTENILILETTDDGSGHDAAAAHADVSPS